MIEEKLYENYVNDTFNDLDDVGTMNNLFMIEMTLAKYYYNYSKEKYLAFENFFGRMLLNEKKFLKDFVFIIVKFLDDNTCLGLFK